MSAEVIMPFVNGGRSEGLTPRVHPDTVVDPLARQGENVWSERFRRAGRALTSLVTLPLRLEIRREYKPVKGNPHGADEHRPRRVLGLKHPERWDAKWAAIRNG